MNFRRRAGFPNARCHSSSTVDVPSDATTFPATSVDKPTLYRDSDILSLHVTMIPGNENLVGRDQLALMKKDAILINTSRGEVLDAAALREAILSKRLAGAALDVFWPEPPAPDFPLLGLDNVLLTPHLAARTYSAIENMSWVTRDIVEVLEGRPPKFPAPAKSLMPMLMKSCCGLAACAPRSASSREASS